MKCNPEKTARWLAKKAAAEATEAQEAKEEDTKGQVWTSPDDEEAIADGEAENSEKDLPEEVAVDEEAERLLHSPFHDWGLLDSAE